MSHADDTIPYGFCHCGCGGKTRIANYTSKTVGWVKGQPKKYILGHHNKRHDPEWKEEDRGFHTLCWIWQWGFSSNGYGAAYVNRVPMGAHRAIYERLVGPIPEGLHVDHLCRQRACVNPEHLDLVPNQINNQRGLRAKLTPDKVRELRKLAAELRNMSEACRRLNVPIAQGTSAIKRITWSNVD